ncbi:MAG TPA: SH3 domain-containing protein [Candidatus Saccharimonadales bacterium]|nr:SH3 domain-containing protein [Candidatus Saccharimonadales bacterium]
MTRKWMLLGAVASLALAPASPAEDLGKSAEPVAPASVTGTITCHGISSVLMTADQEQSLPLKVVSKLGCGDEVTVLSDAEGYTINIRTADGRTGYVAHMFLALEEAGTRKVAALAPQNAQIENGVVRWRSGTVGSEQFTGDGLLVESLTANGVTVQVSLEDTGWKFRANVAVANESQSALFVQPKRLALEQHLPVFKSLAYQDAAHMAAAANHEILRTSASAGPAFVAHSQRTSSADAGAYTVSSYKVPVYSSSPNYLAQHQAAEEQARTNSQGTFANSAREIKAISLHESTIKPGQKLAGAVWFEREAKAQQLLLRVPVGEVIYEFPLSFSDNK